MQQLFYILAIVIGFVTPYPIKAMDNRKDLVQELIDEMKTDQEINQMQIPRKKKKKKKTIQNDPKIEIAQKIKTLIEENQKRFSGAQEVQVIASDGKAILTFNCSDNTVTPSASNYDALFADYALLANEELLYHMHAVKKDESKKILRKKLHDAIKHKKVIETKKNPLSPYLIDLMKKQFIAMLNNHIKMKSINVGKISHLELRIPGMTRNILSYNVNEETISAPDEDIKTAYDHMLNNDCRFTILEYGTKEK